MAEENVTNYKKTLDRFYEYLNGIFILYKDILRILKEELKAIQEDDITSLDKNLIAQQTILFQTKGFDREIAGYVSGLNIQADNLASLILQIPEAEQFRFYTLLTQFNATIQEVRFYKEKCRMILQTKLYYISKVLSGHSGRKDNITYDQDTMEIHGTIYPKSMDTTI